MYQNWSINVTYTSTKAEVFWASTDHAQCLLIGKVFAVHS